MEGKGERIILWKIRKKERSKEGKRKKAKRRGEIRDYRKERSSEWRKETEEISKGRTEVQIMI